MHGERPQSQFLDLDRDEAGIHAATHSDYAVVVFAVTTSFHLLDQHPEPSRALREWQRIKFRRANQPVQ